MPLWRKDVVKSGEGHPPTEVGGQPTLCVWVERRRDEGGDEFCMVYRVESFIKVNRHGNGAVGREGFIETTGYLLGEREECYDGRAVGSETVLGGRERK